MSVASLLLLCPALRIEEDSLKIPDVSIVEASAELLYGLVHQRYILTRAGLAAMVCFDVYCYPISLSQFASG